jgi:3-dehydroquinate dehydratase
MMGCGLHRAHWESGLWKGSEEARQDVLLQAVNLGAEYVDVEFKV